MRATISFEADVTRVNDIMRSLVLEESNALQDAFICLEKATSERIVEGVSEALGHIYTVANQLEQYRDMMVAFERARFETMLPQAADPLPQDGGGDDPAAPAPTADSHEFFPPDLRNRMDETRKLFDSFAGFKETMSNAQVGSVDEPLPSSEDGVTDDKP